MKKMGLVLCAIMMILVLGVGCSKDEESSTPQGSDSTTNNQGDATGDNDATDDTPSDLSGKAITVGRWGGNDSETKAFADMLEAFTAATGITVNERVYSDYNQEIQAELIGGTAPDVFYVDAYMAPFFISQEVLLPLDANEFELDAFYEPLREAFFMDGSYYAVSKDYSTLALYYNKALVDGDAIPDTMEALLGEAYLSGLQATLPEGMIAMTYNQDLARSLFLAQTGGLDITRDGIYANLSGAGIVENLSVEYDAAIAGWIKTPADLGMGWNGDAFGNEATAIMIEGNWVLGHLQTNFPDIEFGTKELPTFKGEKGTMVFTVGYALNAVSKEVDAAKAFIKFATGTEGMAIWTEGAGVLPSRLDVTQSTGVEQDPLKVPHIAGAAYATPWQKGTTMDTINTEFRNYVPSAVSGARSLEEALQLAEDEANQIIEANQ